MPNFFNQAQTNQLQIIDKEGKLTDEGVCQKVVDAYNSIIIQLKINMMEIKFKAGENDRGNQIHTEINTFLINLIDENDENLQLN